MSVELEYENNNQGLIVKYNQVLSGEEALQTVDRFYGSEGIHQLIYLVIDLSDIENIDVSAAQLKSIAQKDSLGGKKTRYGQLKIAIVVRHDVVEGIARLYQHYAEEFGIDFTFMKTLEDANEWARDLLASFNVF